MLTRLQYVDYLVDRHRQEPLEIHWDQMTVTDIERLIQAEANSFTFNVTPGQSYPRQVIVYRFPYSGSRTLLGLRPSQWLAWSQDVVDDGASVTFEVINLDRIQTRSVRKPTASSRTSSARQSSYRSKSPISTNSSQSLRRPPSSQGRRNS